MGPRKPKLGRIQMLGVPMDLGSDLRGVDMGPSAIRIAGVRKMLTGLGYRVEDLGNITVPHASVAGKDAAHLKFLNPISKACKQLAKAVEGALSSGAIPLVLGGDHSIAIGTLAGLARHAHKKGQPGHPLKYGLLWVDAHGDCNTAKTTPSGNIHGMPLAAALGMGVPQLTNLGGLSPMIDPKYVVLYGARDLDSGERKNIRKLGIRVFTMREIDEQGVSKTMQEALQIVTGGTEGFALSFDIDSIDPGVAPGVGTPVPGGLTVREGYLVMELVADTKKMVLCEVVEVNPVLDHKNTTAKLAVQLIHSAFGDTIL